MCEGSGLIRSQIPCLLLFCVREPFSVPKKSILRKKFFLFRFYESSPLINVEILEVHVLKLPRGFGGLSALVTFFGVVFVHNVLFFTEKH